MEQPEETELVNSGYRELMDIMKAVTNTECGIAFLQQLMKWTSFHRPTMNMEDASRKDIWYTVRQYIPVQKLALIEHEHLYQKQVQVEMLLEQQKLMEDQKRYE